MPSLAVANYGSSTLFRFHNSGGAVFFSGVALLAGTNPIGIATGDFFGNGMLDLAVTNFGSNTVSVLPYGGSFPPKVDFDTGVSPQGLPRRTSTAMASPTSPSRTTSRAR